MTDTDRPSGAPLSESEADRLSERFTASWDEPDAVSPPLPPPASVAVAPKPKNQTLLGIAPIVVVSGPPSPVAPVSGSSAAAEPPLVASRPSPPVAAPQAAPSAPSASASPLAAPPTSSPDASAIARGLTTPSKPYVPKDDPSTPAVVISEAALSDAKRKADRARIAQTIPAQTRSAAAASFGPLTPLVPPTATATAATAASTPTISSLHQQPTERRRGRWLLIGGGLATVALATIAVFVSSGPKAPTGSAPQPAAATGALSAVAAETAAPAAPAAEPVATNDAASAEPVARAAPPPVPERKRRPVVKKSASAPVPATRKTSTARSPANQPAAAPPKSKSVIVRETPF